MPPTDNARPDVNEMPYEYGPWSNSVQSGERVAQLRSLAALVAASFGSDHPCVAALRRAESDAGALGPARAVFERLPALTKR